MFYVHFTPVCYWQPKSYSRHIVQFEGQVKLKCSVDSKVRYLIFQVIKLKVSLILGKDACTNLGLLKRLEVNALNLSIKLRNTSIDKVWKSPAPLPMSHRLRTLLLTSHRFLYPHADNLSAVRKRHAECKKKKTSSRNITANMQENNSHCWNQVIVYEYN